MSCKVGQKRAKKGKTAVFSIKLNKALGIAGLLGHISFYDATRYDWLTFYCSLVWYALEHKFLFWYFISFWHHASEHFKLLSFSGIIVVFVVFFFFVYAIHVKSFNVRFVHRNQLQLGKRQWMKYFIWKFSSVNTTCMLAKPTLALKPYLCWSFSIWVVKTKL